MKIPRIFTKTYSEKKLHKKVLSKIHIPAEREFVRQLFLYNEQDGKYHIQTEENKELSKRLKVLAGSIKKNKGLFIVSKVAILFVLSASIVTFNVLFKNRIVENIAERSLETIFGAKTEISDMQFSLLQGKASFKSLEIGDRNNPMKNLIETGSAALNLDTAQLLRKRFHLNELSLSNVRTGTERRTSAELDQRQDRKETRERRSRELQMPDLTALTADIADMDFAAIIDEQKASLQSYQSLEAIIDETRLVKERWAERLEETETRVSSLSADARRLATTNIRGLNNPAALQNLLQEIESSRREIIASRNLLSDIRDEIREDQNRIRNSRNAITAALDADFLYLKDFIQLPASDKMTLAADYARGLLDPEITKWYDRILDATTLLGSIRDMQADRTQTTDSLARQRRQQQFITYPVDEAPRILLENIALDFSGDFAGRASIHNISSNPELTALPVIALAALTSDNLILSKDTILDNRRDYQTLSINFSFGEIPLVLEEQLETITLEEIRGKMQGNVTMELQDAFTKGNGELLITIKNVRAEQLPGAGFIHEAIQALFSEVFDINLAGNFSILEGRVDDINISSNLDDLLSDKIGLFVRQKAAEMEDKLRDELNRYLQNLLEEHAYLDTILSEEDAQAIAGIRSIDDAQTLLDDKRNEIENRAREIRSDAESRVLEEAERRRREAEAEAERVRREAEERAREEAERILDRPGLPRLR